MRQVFDGWGVASKRKVSARPHSSYDILSAPVATDEYISCVERDIIYHSYEHSRSENGSALQASLYAHKHVQLKESWMECHTYIF